MFIMYSHMSLLSSPQDSSRPNPRKYKLENLLCTGIPAKTKRLTNAGSMLVQCLRRWANIERALVKRLVFSGMMDMFTTRGGVTTVLHHVSTPYGWCCIVQVWQLCLDTLINVHVYLWLPSLSTFQVPAAQPELMQLVM